MKKDMTNILKEASLKVTPTRAAVLELFSSVECKPLNAEQIFKKLKSKKIDQVTIYRTLATLEEKDILKKADLRKGSTHYELASHHHHHIVCTSCGMTEEFSNPHVEVLIEKAASKASKFKVVDQHALELFGTCVSCARK